MPSEFVSEHEIGVLIYRSAGIEMSRFLILRKFFSRTDLFLITHHHILHSKLVEVKEEEQAVVGILQCRGGHWILFFVLVEVELFLGELQVEVLPKPRNHSLHILTLQAGLSHNLHKEHKHLNESLLMLKEEQIFLAESLPEVFFLLSSCI